MIDHFLWNQEVPSPNRGRRAPHPGLGTTGPLAKRRARGTANRRNASIARAPSQDVQRWARLDAHTLPTCFDLPRHSKIDGGSIDLGSARRSALRGRPFTGTRTARRLVTFRKAARAPQVVLNPRRRASVRPAAMQPWPLLGARAHPAFDHRIDASHHRQHVTPTHTRG